MFKLGIDLGTTYTTVAVVKNGRPEIIHNEWGASLTPSCIAFSDERLIGETALTQSQTNPENTISYFKRLMGRDYDREMIDSQKLSYKCIPGPSGDIRICVNYQNKLCEFSPTEIASMILTFIREHSSKVLGQDITGATLTVPAYFSNSQRTAVHQAAEIAGFKEITLLNEPTAAAIAFGFGSGFTNQNICVFDCGGGTTDITILNIDKDKHIVKSTAGNSNLGGINFDHAMLNLVSRLFGIEDINSDINRAVRLELLTKCERAKKILSSSLSTTVEWNGKLQTIARAQYEAEINDLIGDCIFLAKRAMQDACLVPEQINQIILIGGSTRIPKLRGAIESYFCRAPNYSINPDQAVAFGAAINSSQSLIEDSSLVLVDVIPLSLGIETKGGMMCHILKRNTAIPTKASQIFSTCNDNQTSVKIKVYEGESLQTQHDHPLGQFELVNITPAPRGAPRILVVFSIDKNGLLNVQAADQQTKNEQSIEISAQQRILNQTEIEQAILRAQTFREEDLQQQEMVEKKNKIYDLCFALKNIISSEETQWLRDLLERVNDMDHNETNSSLDLLISRWNSFEEQKDK